MSAGTESVPGHAIRRLRAPQGLDGEATEPIVSSLADPQASQADPEEEFQVAAALASRQGPGGTGHLSMLVTSLADVLGRRGADSADALQLIRLLHHAVQLQVLPPLLDRCCMLSDSSTLMVVVLAMMSAC